MRRRNQFDAKPGWSGTTGQRTSGQFIVRVAHLSDHGLKRTNNEDSVLILRLIRDSGDRMADGRLLAVADGMGGLERGEVASRLTLTALSAYLVDHLGEVPEEDVPGHLEFLQKALAVVNERVYASQDPQAPAKMGSTVVFAYMAGPSLFVAHAGDSRCYLFRDRRIELATRDHSVVQALIDAGEITQAQAAVHSQRHRITNGIGFVPPDRFRATVRHLGDVRDLDYLLLCSDGLHGSVDDDEIARAVYEGEDAASGASALLELAMAAGAPDNVSLVLARVVSRESEHVRIDFGALWRWVRRLRPRFTGSRSVIEGHRSRGQRPPRA